MKNRQYQKKIEKIFNKVNNIAAKGKDNIQEYYNYIDELIIKGDYGMFLEVLDIFYDIDFILEKDVNVVKLSTWKEICFQTKTPFLTKLSLLYKQKKVHQQINQIFSDDINLVNTQLSNKYSATFSATSLSPSVIFNRVDENIFMTVNDNTIQRIEIKKAEWKNIGGIYQPTYTSPIDEFIISYDSYSYTSLDLDDVNIGQSLTFSSYDQKSFISEQYILLANKPILIVGDPSNIYIAGTISNYNYYTGELNLTVATFSGNGLHSNWNIKYISGTQSPYFKTNISTAFGSEYVVKTSNDLTGEVWNYKLNLEKLSLLGTIDEIDFYDQNSRYLVQNKQYAKLIGERKFYLEVNRLGSTQSIGIFYENPAFSEDQNHIERYRYALDYLITGTTASS